MSNHDTNTEQSVLGGLLVDPEEAKKLVRTVVRIFGNRRKAIFYEEEHQAIFETILELHSRGEPTDVLAVSSHLRKRGKKVTSSYLSETVAHALPPTVVEYHARQLRELAVRRNIERFAQILMTKVKGETPTATLIQEMQSRATSLRKEGTPEKPSMTIAESLRTPVIQPAVPIGGGMVIPGRYTILAATDNEGKTTLCTQLGLCGVTATPFLGRFPIPKPVKVLYFCGENSRGDINEKVQKQIAELERMLGRGIEKELQNFRIVEPLDIDFMLNKGKDLSSVSDWLEAWRPNLVFFDPLNNFISGDESLSNDTIARNTAKALNKLASEFRCFPVLTTHFKKENEVRPASIFEKFHGSKYWTNPAAAQIAMERADQKKYASAKKIYFNCKTVGEMPPMLILRNKDTLWYTEISSDELSKAKLVAEDVVEILRRKCGGEAVPSIFEEVAAEELSCTKRQIRELLAAAKRRGLVAKKSGLFSVVEFAKRKGQDLIPREDDRYTV